MAETKRDEVESVERRLLDVAEVSKIFGVDRKLIYRMAREGDLPGIRLSRGPKARWRFDRADIDVAIQRRKVTA